MRYYTRLYHSLIFKYASILFWKPTLKSLSLLAAWYLQRAQICGCLWFSQWFRSWASSRSHESLPINILETYGNMNLAPHYHPTYAKCWRLHCRVHDIQAVQNFEVSFSQTAKAWAIKWEKMDMMRCIESVVSNSEPALAQHRLDYIDG